MRACVYIYINTYLYMYSLSTAHFSRFQDLSVIQAASGWLVGGPPWQNSMPPQHWQSIALVDFHNPNLPPPLESQENLTPFKKQASFLGIQPLDLGGVWFFCHGNIIRNAQHLEDGLAKTHGNHKGFNRYHPVTAFGVKN